MWKNDALPVPSSRRWALSFVCAWTPPACEWCPLAPEMFLSKWSDLCTAWFRFQIQIYVCAIYACGIYMFRIILPWRYSFHEVRVLLECTLISRFAAFIAFCLLDLFRFRDLPPLFPLLLDLFERPIVDEFLTIYANNYANNVRCANK